MQPVCLTRQATVFSAPYFLTNCKVFKRRCRKCQQEVFYDGRECGLANYQNLMIFPIELLYEALEMKTHSGVPTLSWWRGKVEVACFGVEPSEVEGLRRKWTNMHAVVNLVLTEFIMLIDFPESLFRCCSDPDIVCIDGIVLSIESWRIRERNFTAPWRETTPSKQRATTRKDRNCWYLPESATWKPRKLLRQFALRDGGLTRSEITQLIQKHPGPFSVLLNRIAYPVIKDGLEVFMCPAVLQPFFHSASKPISPAIGVIPKVLWEPTAMFLSTRRLRNDNYINLVREHSILLNCLVTFIISNVNKPALTEACRAVIHHCLTIAQESASEAQEKYNVMPLGAFPAPEPFCARKEYEETGFFFPGRPIHSRVTNCMLSKTDESDFCNKDYKESGRYGAGMALFWCGRHRECIGWILLQKGESLEIIYSALVTRFQKLPKFIIYDNGCNLYEYCANRAPNLFADTIILSDGFHWSNHHNCSRSFNSSLMLAIAGISSVTHEQKNAYLAKFKSISIFMRFDSFSQIMHYVLHNMNYRERGCKLERQ